MSSRYQVYFIAFVLIALGLGITFYKSNEMGFPLVKGESKEVWTVEAVVTFRALTDPKEAKVSLTLPNQQSGIVILDEQYTTNGYGLTTREENNIRQAQWSIRQASGPQRLYYKTQLLYDWKQQIEQMPEPNLQPQADFNKNELAAAQTIVDKAFDQSSDVNTLVKQLIEIIQTNDLPEVGFLLQQNLELGSKPQLIKNLLALKGVDSTIVRGVYLEDGQRRKLPSEVLSVYVDNEWKLYNFESDRDTSLENFLIWQIGGNSLLDVEGGVDSQVRFSIISNFLSSQKVAVWNNLYLDGEDADLSIYALPIEQQSVFKLILLIPLGALVVVFLRVLVGIKTSGTFMPVLIALAFLETTLITGLPVFLTIILIGLLIRSYLSNINLLLVARVAAIVTIVVGLMGLISITSHKLGIEQGLTVTFFPMIILAWTIERMSIVWEEEGPKDVLVQGSGSLLVAIACYFVMTSEAIIYIAFNFPEIHLATLGAILILGQYNGYRLSELVRFGQVSKSEDEWNIPAQKSESQGGN
ncbi:inactive transglutaminase family protein [Bacterioplanoides sp. SCSIO 12839]|uniref:inactive transglutaminase family protein n=1 Tax=Bacterioplanoides sp. SCSIO 12839 TaxID=2829569 RepID=UPI002102C5B0|nr:inactive transglutaminase family protein [Bacterioplanoides sp. SCSIO 12839]UTW48880.1 inactive transglutaminase family protein [Bacterioplanoides sp. SCSIO 12839]